MKTIIIGLGDAVAHNDGAAAKAVGMVCERLGDRQDVDCMTMPVGGVIDEMAGYERAIIVDVMQTRRFAPGTVRTFTPRDILRTKHLPRMTGNAFFRFEDSLPREVVICGIETGDGAAGDLSDSVSRGVNRLVDMIMRDFYTPAGL